MTDKPPTTDPEQRKADTEASRRQSGLPPEREDGPDRTADRPDRAGRVDPAERSGKDA